MKIFYVFDVDGVLCDRGCSIDINFKQWFLNWSKDKTYYIHTGSPREKTIGQIGQEICDNSKISFHCLGNSIWLNNIETIINEFTFNKEELDYFDKVLKSSSFNLRTGNHINKRSGSYNFSVVGRNANIEQRKSYIAYDKLTQERISIVKDIRERFPRLDAFLGGDISIDICLRGADKSNILNVLGWQWDKLYFFGDTIFPYGVDYPVYQIAGLGERNTMIQIDNGYKQTQTILETL